MSLGTSTKPLQLEELGAQGRHDQEAAVADCQGTESPSLPCCPPPGSEEGPFPPENRAPRDKVGAVRDVLLPPFPSLRGAPGPSRETGRPQTL